jgi:hypothetical protein
MIALRPSKPKSTISFKLSTTRTIRSIRKVISAASIDRSGGTGKQSQRQPHTKEKKSTKTCSIAFAASPKAVDTYVSQHAQRERLGACERCFLQLGGAWFQRSRRDIRAFVSHLIGVVSMSLGILWSLIFFECPSCRVTYGYTSVLILLRVALLAWEMSF